MNTPPFKRGDRVALHEDNTITGTVFFVKRNTEDRYRYSRTRGNVRYAKRGDWSIGVEWDKDLQADVPLSRRVNWAKFQPHNALVKIEQPAVK